MEALPSSRSPLLRIVELSPGEILTQTRLNSHAWRGPLSVEAYLRREQTLASQTLTQNSGITYWGLVENNNEDHHNRVMLAGCESIRKRALVARFHEQGLRVEETITHGIASVFCPPSHRGRGYAARMMQEIAKILPTWQTRDMRCLFSVLYSDIGKVFYNRHGWKPYKSSHIRLRPIAVDDDLRISEQSKKVTLLRGQDLQKLCVLDESCIRDRLANLEPTLSAMIVLIPDQQTMSWHHAREDFMAQELYNCVPSIKGVCVELQRTRKVWCIFTRTWYNEDKHAVQGNTLYILRFASASLADQAENHISAIDGTNGSDIHLDGLTEAQEDIDACAVLLRKALDQAREWNMDDVEIWNPSPAIMSAAKLIDHSVNISMREQESIASLNWFGGKDMEVRWLANEKFGWC